MELSIEESLKSMAIITGVAKSRMPNKIKNPIKWAFLKLNAYLLTII